MTEPRRPRPADGTTFTSINWETLSPQEWEKYEAELRDAIRNRSQGDFWK
jgi:hypothetical protein